VAAFASINAMQGYRPVPVTQFAVQLMNAKSAQPPALPDPGVVADAADYAGVYTSGSGKQIELRAESGKLSIGAAVQLEQAGDDTFVATAPEWDHFPLLFGRMELPAGSHEKGPVVELAYGPDWYTRASYAGPKSFTEPAHLLALTGFYQSDSAWSGGVRIVLRKGSLWADGATPLQPIGDALFRLGEEPFGPDTAEFHYVVEGKAQLLKLNGADYWRVAME
jgi:hypothetical protein